MDIDLLISKIHRKLVYKLAPRLVPGQVRALQRLNETATEPVVAPGGPVVSLTTYGPRIDTVHLTIESIGRGRLKLREIFDPGTERFTGESSPACPPLFDSGHRATSLAAELIWYHRPDVSGTRRSDYHRRFWSIKKKRQEDKAVSNSDRRVHARDFDRDT